MFRGHFRAEGDFHHIAEPQFADSGKELFNRSGELRFGGRSYHCHHFFAAVFQYLKHLQHMRSFHNSAERALTETLSARDTFFEIDFRGMMFIFADCADGA